MNHIIPNSTIIVMAGFAILNTIIPILIAYRYKRFLDTKVSTFFIGLFTYILFAMILIQIPDILIRGSIKPFANLIENQPLVSVLYFTTMTTIMEEVGRLFIYKTMMKKRMTKQESLMMGVGHGGIYAMFTGSAIMMTNAILAFSINAFGIDGYAGRLGHTGEALESSKQGMIAFAKISGMQHFFDGSVTLILMAGQIALSYLVFKSISDKTKKYLYPVAIGMHFVLLLPLNLNRKEVVTNTFIIELIMLFIVMGIIYFSYRMYQNDTGSEA